MLTTQKERSKTINLFLSYAMEDRKYSKRIENLINLRSNLKLFSTDMLSAGEDWQKILRQKISQSDIFITIRSLNSSNSSFVLLEFGAALGLEKPIIVIDIHSGLVDKLPMEFTTQKVHHFDIESLEDPNEVRKFFETIEDIASNN